MKTILATRFSNLPFDLLRTKETDDEKQKSLESSISI